MNTIEGAMRGPRDRQPKPLTYVRDDDQAVAETMERIEIGRTAVRLCHRLGTENVELLRVANSVADISGDTKWATRAIVARLKLLRSYLDDAIANIESESQ